MAVARFTLLAALSLDGAWRSDALAPGLLLKRLGVAEAVTDWPALRRRRVPGLRWAAADDIAAGPGRPVLGTPALHALLLQRRELPDLLLLQCPELVLDRERATLAAPFLPADGKRARFRLRATRTVPEGLVCHYVPAAQVKPGKA